MSIIIREAHKIDVFTNIFKHLKAFGKYFNLMFDENRLYIQGMDEAHVALFEVYLINEWFDEYTIKDAIIVGLDIEILFKILHMKRDGQIIQIDLTVESDTFDITFIGKIKQTFNIPIMDIDTELLAVPEDTEWAADIEIQSKLLANLMSDQSFFGDVVQIKCTEKEVIITTNDQTIGKMASQLPFDDLIEYSIEENATIEVSYSLQYILFMTRFSELAPIVTMNISKTIPLRLYYALNTKEDTNNYMKFYLAPKIDDY